MHLLPAGCSTGKRKRRPPIANNFIASIAETEGGTRSDVGASRHCTSLLLETILSCECWPLMLVPRTCGCRKRSQMSNQHMHMRDCRCMIVAADTCCGQVDLFFFRQGRLRLGGGERCRGGRDRQVPRAARDRVAAAHEGVHRVQEGPHQGRLQEHRPGAPLQRGPARVVSLQHDTCLGRRHRNLTCIEGCAAAHASQLSVLLHVRRSTSGRRSSRGS